MTFEEYKEIYLMMVEVLKRDKELTHIDVSFHIKPIRTEKKTARIYVKTFKEK